MNTAGIRWDIEHLREHLQFAIQLEYWTIPFYMSAMYSVKDPTSNAYKLVNSVVNQEMLHLQLAANVANAFETEIDLEHAFITPVYEGQTVPHLMFSAGEIGRDPVDPGQSYAPYSAEIGPLDEARINTMCLIEYPEDDVDQPPPLKQDVTEYSTIGEFYRALLFGATQHVSDIRANRNQVDMFGNFYRDFPCQTITCEGVAGLQQVVDLVHAITDQGEGVRRTDTIPKPYRNTADGFNAEMDHFEKFNLIKNLTALPECYDAVMDPPAGSDGAKAQATLVRNFNRFRGDLVALFNGRKPENFGPHMATLGGNILDCWRNGAVPRFQ
ncbi:MAG: ferritin-like domain-containing protein [Wenzhouxiangellaceae bacterium]